MRALRRQPHAGMAGLVFALLISSCGGGGSGTSTPGGPPPTQSDGPVVTSVLPDTIVAGHYDATVTVLGPNFAHGAVVKLNGVAVPTERMSSGKLRFYVVEYTMPPAGV